MRQVPAGEFETRCLRVIEEVKISRQSVVITKKGKPVAKLVPVDEAPPDIFGCMAGTADIGGDIVSSVVSATRWRPIA